jgi:DNA-directed RNA polymerase I subunit RPA43
MSVSAADMVGRDGTLTPTSSRKRKHTDEEQAQRKKLKKQKHLEVENSSEVVAHHEIRSATENKKRRRKGQDAGVHELPVAQQEAHRGVELPALQENAVALATEETPVIRKKGKKRKAIAEAGHAATEQEDIELPDAEDEALTSPQVTKSTVSTLQPTPPSESIENSPFYTTRVSLYVPCPAISLNTTLPSLISTHLTPLLLTYYAPLNGILLSITDASISSAAANSPGQPLLLPPLPPLPNQPQLALCADEAGVSFTWLTVTATTFNPAPNSTLSGYINVASEGFIGLILYNYFQVGIPKTRIPRGWKWTAPGGPADSGSGTSSSKKQSKKGRIRDAESEESSQQNGSTTAIPDSQTDATHHDTDANHDADSTATILQNTGYWTRTDGSIVSDSSPLSFRVVDCEIVPSSTRGNADKSALQIEGTLLDEEEENRIVEEERAKFERAQDKAHGRARSPGARNQANMMSGGLGVLSREGSVAAAGLRHRVRY